MTQPLIIALGASAGGIQALVEFFEHAPSDAGLVYVVLLHLSPNHDSQLAQVLQRSTKMKVAQVVSKTRIEPDNVYVISPDKHLTLEDRYIISSPNLQMAERRAPVDIFFRSLAEAHKERAVGVILSGTGANGSMGLKRIKESGGAVFVQNPREAEFNEMPRNAISTDLVDDVLNVAEIPGRILLYRDTLEGAHIEEESENRVEEDQRALRDIFTQLRLRTGHDFSNYKRATLMRRIGRRMAIRGLTALPDYAAFSNQHPEETQALLKDLLISVTNFFRDKTPFTALEEDILPAIFENKTAEERVRIWVAGCATGEEAYSIAMLCAERTLGVMDAPKVQIFATDIDETAIAAGRDGFYSMNDAADISAERLNRFFVREEAGYRVRREIRETILFAHHNFLKDPPFSRIDLVSCRNVLIYLNRPAQERVMETFHFAMRPGGFLLLGTSESVDTASDLFRIYNREQHIYQSRVAANARSIVVPETVPQLRAVQPVVQPVDVASRAPSRIIYSDLHLQLVEQYAPPSLVVNADFDIVHLSPRAGRYLTMNGGEPTQSLLKLIRDELRAEVRNGLYQAAQKGVPVNSAALPVRTEDGTEEVYVHVRPVIGEQQDARGYLLIVFEPASGLETRRETVAHTTNESATRQLEEELARLRAQLRASNEQHEFQAEELKAGNEELQAMNEELRSATEELETSKEELQSINEELSTVNQELKVKVEEATMVSNNLQNLINSTDIGTIFLDRSFRVVLFTPAVRSLFNLIPADFGRPLSDIKSRLLDDTLLDDAATVLERLQMIEREAESTEGRTFLIRLAPYRTEEDRIQGVVISLVDITERKNADRALRESEEQYRTLFTSIDEGFCTIEVIFDKQENPVNYRFLQTNPAFARQTGIENAVGRTARECVPDLEAFWYEVYGRISTSGEAARFEHAVKGLGKYFDVYAFRIGEPEQHRIAVIFKDILERKLSEKALQESEERFRLFVTAASDIMYRMSADWSKMLWLDGKNFLADTRNPSLTWLEEYIPDSDKSAAQVEIQAAIRAKRTFELEHRVIRADGTIGWAFSRAVPFLGEQGRIIEWFGVASDITDRKRQEANLAFLSEIGQDLAGLTKAEDTLDVLSEKIGSYLNASRVMFAEVDESQRRIAARTNSWSRSGLPDPENLYLIVDSSAMELARSGRAGRMYVVHDVDTDIRTDAGALREVGIRAFLSISMLREHRSKFQLAVFDEQARNWRDDEIEIIQELAARIWARVERARAEEALRESEERFRAVANLVPDLLWDSEPNGWANWHNQRWSEYTGQTPEEATGWGWLEAIHPEDRDAYTTRYQAAVTAGLPMRHEHRIRRYDGAFHWFVFNAFSLRNESGHVVKVYGAATNIHEARSALGSLRVSEDQYRTLFSSIDEGFCTVEVLFDDQGNAHDYRFIETNPAFDRQTGLANAVGRTMRELAPGHEEFWFETYGQIARTGKALRFEHGASELGKYYDVYAFRIGEPGEHRVAILFNDILLRKQTENALRESEDRLRVTMETAIDYAIITMDPARLIQGWSRGAERTFEYTEEEAIGQSGDIIFTPEDRAAGAPQHEMETAHDEGMAPDERWHIRKYGERFYMSGVMRPIYNNGVISGYVKVARDMTRHKESEEALRISEERYRNALQSAEMAAWDWDVPADSVVWNDQHYTILGLQTDGNPHPSGYFMDFVHPDDVDYVHRELIQAVEDTGVYRAEFRIIRADNQEARWMSGYGSAVIRDDDGKVTRMVGVMYDITRRKRVEEQKEEFIGIASHELKTPLSSIKAYSEVLHEMFSEAGDDQSVRLVGKMGSQIDRLTGLVNSLLDVTRIREGKLELEKEPFELEALVRELMEEMQRTTSTRLELIGSVPVMLIADRKGITQVIANLLSNAIKYARRTEHIDIRITSVDDEVVVSVRDFGIGMSPEVSAQIFERFFRAMNAVTGTYPGLGLGLYISAEIIRLHGGRIWVISKENEGSTFSFSLPLAR